MILILRFYWISDNKAVFQLEKQEEKIIKPAYTQRSCFIWPHLLVADKERVIWNSFYAPQLFEPSSCYWEEKYCETVASQNFAIGDGIEDYFYFCFSIIWFPSLIWKLSKLASGRVFLILLSLLKYHLVSVETNKGN